jgi:hypothetical protein
LRVAEELALRYRQRDRSAEAINVSCVDAKGGEAASWHDPAAAPTLPDANG